MTTYRLEASNDWSLPRTLSLAGAFAVHAGALVLLAMPMMRPGLPAAAVEAVQIVWHEPEPEPVAIPLPPEPKPLPVPRRPITRTPAVVAAPESPMSTPAPLIEPLPLPADPAAIDGPPAIDSTPAGGADISLAYASRTQLAYPKASMRNHEQGTVLLRVHVDREGRPTAIDLVRSSGHDRLDRAARESVRGWRFRPVQRNGVAVPASGLVPVAFSLERG